MASYRYGISNFIVHFYLILNMAYFKEILMKTENTYIKYKGTKSSAWHCTRVHARCCVTQNFKRWNIEMIDFHFETPSPPKMKLVHLLEMIDNCEASLIQPFLYTKTKDYITFLVIRKCVSLIEFPNNWKQGEISQLKNNVKFSCLYYTNEK